MPRCKSGSLVDQLLSLYTVFKDAPSKEKILLDLSQVDWFCPLLVLTLSAYLQDAKSEYTEGHSEEVQSYLNAISFPAGVNSVSAFQEKIQEQKSFVPISVLERESGPDRERLESLFGMMIYKILGSVPGAQNAIYYPITELVTNIFDHSQEERGFVFGQFYPKKEYLDICIADRGQGLTATYKQQEGIELSDEDAIIKVMSGDSTKSDKERGYGVRTSQQVVCKALGGSFIMISGSAALVSDEEKERIVALPGFYWQGVVIAYRIPQPEKAIDISPYLE